MIPRKFSIYFFIHYTLSDLITLYFSFSASEACSLNEWKCLYLLETQAGWMHCKILTSHTEIWLTHWACCIPIYSKMHSPFTISNDCIVSSCWFEWLDPHIVKLSIQRDERENILKGLPQSWKTIMKNLSLDINNIRRLLTIY